MIPRRKGRVARRAKRKVAPSRYAKRTAYAITILLLLIMVLSGALYSKGYIGMPGFTAMGSIALSLFFTSIVFSWMIFTGSTPGMIVRYLGLTRDKISVKVICIGIALFVAIVILGMVVNSISNATGVPLPTNVQNVFAGAPLYFLIFTAIIAPINEEILFRGFLVSKLGKMFGIASGIIVSALIFAVLHLSYLSIAEFVAAFTFGIIAGYAFVKTKSLYPSIVGHILVNAVTITSLIYVGMLIHP
ncbi:MAG: type II CAAX endopeptidase family protein [Candidatus Micrarchaeaceae archaeon]|jgi:membrane protease YdiL (CAAX protease family)|nr:CPBP family intramembrane metalloprotease [Candidatus Micrarchaeota archaeon]HII10283.1 CPBP family intramembrane metalloprotease [Candidatus Micrarchaeota archaeon]